MHSPARILSVVVACALLAASGIAVPSAGGALPAHLKSLPAGVLEVGPAPYGLDKSSAGDTSRLWLPGGAREFKVESIALGADGISTRFGKVAGLGSGAVTLGPDGGFGRIVDGTTIWFLEIRDGQTYAVRAGEGGLAIAADDAVVRGVMAQGLRKAGTAVLGQMRSIDVAALYDPDFAARYPGGLAATRIQHFVALANQAFIDSGIAVTLQVVQQQLAAGAVPPSILDDVDDMLLAGGSGGSFAGVNLNALRQNSGADLISFFRVHDMYFRDACGVAYFPAGAGLWAYGVNVVVDGEHAGSICDDYVFAHEVGHNLGAGHQLPDAGYFAGSHAFVRLGQFNTIMGSFGTGKADRFRRVPYFSNPLIACGNLPCGVAGASDNAGTMNALRDTVADYHVPLSGSTPTPPAPFNADSDGDSVIDRIDAFPFDALESIDADGDGVPASRDAFPTNSTEWRDSDSGGLGDNADLDDDNDGVPDGSDAFPLDPTESVDSDGDGTGNVADAFDADPYEQRDTDLDGTGDRADADDDADGTVDVAAPTGLANGELLVADGATDRILRFRGSDMAPLGTLVQLAPGEVSLRSEMAVAPSGELYFIAGSEVRRLDRLRSATPQLFLATAFHPSFGTGFPLSPVVLSSGDVVISEWGQGATAALRPGLHADGLPPLRADYWTFISPSEPVPKLHLTAYAGHILGFDGAGGSMLELDYDLHSGFGAPTQAVVGAGQVVPGASAGVALAANMMWWVDRRDGTLRRFLISGGPAVTSPVTGADARAIVNVVDAGPSQRLFVARRSGGVWLYDGASAADLGQAISAADVAEPLALAWAPSILDASMPAIVPPIPPAATADPALTPAVGGSTPPAPPCTTACIDTSSTTVVTVTNGGGGGGGAPDPALLALLLAALYARRRFTSSSARTAAASSSPPRS